MNIRFAPNTLYYGDCLNIMADFPNDCVDLICLDPPFNSNANYHTIFRGSGLSIKPQIKAFDDMWLWDADSEQRVHEIKNAIANPASKVIAAFEMIMPQTPMLSYTSYMAQRLFAMHRVLKDTGSIYLHCDPTASHYLKLVMDAVFGERNFRNEIIWCYAGGDTPKWDYPRKHDIIFRYSNGTNVTFNVEYRPYGEHNTTGERATDRGGTRNKEYRKEGTPINDWWTDIKPVINWSSEASATPPRNPSLSTIASSKRPQTQATSFSIPSQAVVPLSKRHSPTTAASSVSTFYLLRCGSSTNIEFAEVSICRCKACLLTKKRRLYLPKPIGKSSKTGLYRS